MWTWSEWKHVERRNSHSPTIIMLVIIGQCVWFSVCAQSCEVSRGWKTHDFFHCFHWVVHYMQYAIEWVDATMYCVRHLQLKQPLNTEASNVVMMHNRTSPTHTWAHAKCRKDQPNGSQVAALISNLTSEHRMSTECVPTFSQSNTSHISKTRKMWKCQWYNRTGGRAPVDRCCTKALLHRFICNNSFIVWIWLFTLQQRTSPMPRCIWTRASWLEFTYNIYAVAVKWRCR